MESEKKKHRPKKEQKLEPSLAGYWDAPPVVPIQNIRNMMSSLEKELELLCGTNESKRNADEAMQKSSNLTPVTLPVSEPHKNQSDYTARSTTKVIRQTVSHLQPGTTPSSVQKSMSLVRHSNFAFDRYKRYKARVLEAYQNQKIFTIYGYYPSLKASLLRRGWIEKLGHDNQRGLQRLSQHSLIQNARNGNNYETAILSKMLENYPAHFIWQPKYHYDFHSYAHPHRNRIKLHCEFDFTTKEGLVACINRAFASSTLGIVHILYPRTYRLAYRAEVTSFERNFRLTHCFSLLLYVSEMDNLDDVFSATGDVEMSCLDFAFKRIEKELSIKKNEPNDTPDLKSVTDLDWKNFMDGCDNIMNKKLKVLQVNPGENINMDKIRKIVVEAKKYFPSFKMDGYSNVWIMKPSNYCRGFGILLMTDMQEVINYSRRKLKLRYIVQKYIERPLLIYKTKFDIRQYVLVTISETITIYLYKDCYVKFSSQEFNLTNLHESVHVTNFAIQSKYKNGIRSYSLPPHNMWSLNELKAYFKTINKENIWENCVFPKMKETAIAVILASLDSAELVPNAFELFGIDFMLTEDFEPILLEINATPDMSSSTCVTATVCPATLEDVVKVVVDHSRNQKASIGNFDVAYRVPWSKTENNKPIIVQGVNLVKPVVANIPKVAQIVPANRSIIRKRIPPNTNKACTHGKQVNNKIQVNTAVALKKCAYPVPMVKDAFTKNKTNPKLMKSTTINRNRMLTSSSADAFIQQFVEIVTSIHCLSPNGSKKDVNGNRVLQVVESLYDENRKQHGGKPIKEIGELKKPAELLLGKNNVKRKNLILGEEKILKNFIEVVYNKIWK